MEKDVGWKWHKKVAVALLGKERLRSGAAEGRVWAMSTELWSNSRSDRSLLLFKTLESSLCPRRYTEKFVSTSPRCPVPLPIGRSSYHLRNWVFVQHIYTHTCKAWPTCPLLSLFSTHSGDELCVYHLLLKWHTVHCHSDVLIDQPLGSINYKQMGSRLSTHHSSILQEGFSSLGQEGGVTKHLQLNKLRGHQVKQRLKGFYFILFLFLVQLPLIMRYGPELLGC